VGFLGLFVKLALQTNQKLGLKSLQWVLLWLKYIIIKNWYYICIIITYIIYGLTTYIGTKCLGT
jgi:hypothetical protein